MFPHIHWQNSKVAYHLHLTKLNGHSQFLYHQLHHKPSSPGVFPTSLTVPSCPLCWLFLLTFPRLSNFYLSSSSLWSKLQANIFSPQRAFSFQWTTVVWHTMFKSKLINTPNTHPPPRPIHAHVPIHRRPIWLFAPKFSLHIACKPLNLISLFLCVSTRPVRHIILSYLPSEHLLHSPSCHHSRPGLHYLISAELPSNWFSWL